jgi:hypothetical protein
MSDFKDFTGQTLKWTAIGGVCLAIVAGGAFLLNVATQPMRLTIQPLVVNIEEKK